MRRLGQPEVVGSLLAGVLLGPSVLGAAWPRAAAFMLPPGEESHLLGAVTGFCLLMLLVVLGAETNLPLLRELGRAAAAVSVGSIVVPLLAGAAAAYAFAGILVDSNTNAATGAILLGGALGVSSLPIIARLVTELGVGRRDFGQLALAVATANDIYGFLLLVAVGVAALSTGLAGMLLPIGGLLVMLFLLVAFGQRSVDTLLRRVRLRGPNPSGSLTVMIAVALVAAAAMQLFGIEAALGAFFAGVIVGRSRFRHSRAMEHLEAFSTSVFAPLYFAAAGLQVNLLTLRTPAQAGALIALLVVAIASKAAGVALSARLARLQRRETAALMVLLNGRGAMQVILGTAGLRMGLLSATAYTILLIVSIISSVLISPVLRLVVGEWSGSEREQQRLAREDLLRSRILVRAQRLLVPGNVGQNPAAALTLLDQVWPAEAELTILGEVPPAVSPTRPVRTVAADAIDPAQAVVTEANLGYGVIGVGLRTPLELLDPSEPMTQLLNTCPLPLVAAIGDLPAVPPRRVAVAVTGTTASLAAEELAHGLCPEGTRLMIVHMTPPRHGPLSAPFNDTGRVVADDARTRARGAGVRARVARQIASGPTGPALADWAASRDIDVLVVGTRLRRVKDRPFLGHTVDHLLRDGRSTRLIIVALPESTAEDSDQPYARRQHA